MAKKVAQPQVRQSRDEGPWIYGQTVVEHVHEFEMVLDPFMIFPELTPEILEKHRHWLEPDFLDKATGRIVGASHSYVIRTPHNIIVVDTGCGNDKHRPNRPHYHMARHPYLERLAAINVRPEDVDFVLNTHMHGDHVGWNTRLVDERWVPTFPNATYLFSKKDWKFWSEHANRRTYNPDAYFEDSIAPILEAGQVELIDDGFSPDKDVTVEETPGHTPGHLCVRIEYEGHEAVMSGDLFHHPLQIAEPSLNSCFCIGADMSRLRRQEFYDRCLERNTLVMPAHTNAPSAGRILSAGGGHLQFAYQVTYDASMPDKGENND